LKFKRTEKIMNAMKGGRSMRKIIIGRLGLLVAIFVSLFPCFASESPVNFLLREGPEILRPYVWLNASLVNTDASFQKELDYGDPLRVTTLILDEWIARRDEKKIGTRINQIIDKWKLLEPDGHLNYTFSYGRLQAGWWSGMDSWEFPMLLTGLWQETGRQDYKALAEKLIARASRKVTDGGTVWREADGCWFSAYAWKGMKVADEFRVLNGHLYALQAVKMLARALGDKNLEELYQCGVKGTKAYSKQFPLGDKWVLYMLHPKTINQTHYVIFETMQFDALAALDSDPFFRDQAKQRRALLQRHFPVHARTVAGVNYLTVSALGAPHPYSIDTYALYLECSDGSRQAKFAIPNPTDTRLPVVQRAMLNTPTDLDVAKTKCRVDAEYVGKRFTIYEAPVVVLKGVAVPGHAKDFAVEASLDAVPGPSGSFIVDPARRSSPIGSPDTYLDTQGRLVITPRASIAITANKLVGIEFDANGPLKVGVMIVSSGREFFRYYPATLAGERTLVLLSPLGFDGGEKMTSLDRLTMYIYTDQQKRSVTITPRKLIIFNNQVELYEYFKRVNPNFYTE